MWDDPPNTPIDTQLRERVKAVLPRLTPRERKVISDRFGMAGDTPLSLDEIRQRYGLDVQRLRQIESKVLRWVHESDKT